MGHVFLMINITVKRWEFQQRPYVYKVFGFSLWEMHYRRMICLIYKIIISIIIERLIL